MRTTEEIQTQMDEVQATQPALSPLNSTSDKSIFKNFKKLIAQACAIAEGLWDNKQVEFENTLAYGATSSLPYMRNKAFEFQYGDSLVMDANMIPRYPAVNIDARIISRCTIEQDIGAVVNIYVAKNDPPEKLTDDEVAALLAYFSPLNGFGYAGQNINVISLDPELFFIEAEIAFNGKNSKTIKNDVFTAITNYLNTLGVNPIFSISALIEILKSVPGFVDIKLKNVSVRDPLTPFGGGTDIIASYAVALTQYKASAGYLVPETTSGETFSDKITFTSI